MQDAYVVTGTLTDGRTVILDEGVPLGAVRVRVVIEPLGADRPAPSQSYQEVMAEIRRRQLRRGHQAPEREAVDAVLRDERASWDTGSQVGSD